MKRMKEDTEESDEAPRAVLTDRSTCVLGSGSEQLFLHSKQDSGEVLSSGLSYDTVNSFGTDKKHVLSHVEIRTLAQIQQDTSAITYCRRHLLKFKKVGKCQRNTNTRAHDGFNILKKPLQCSSAFYISPWFICTPPIHLQHKHFILVTFQFYFFHCLFRWGAGIHHCVRSINTLQGRATRARRALT